MRHLPFDAHFAQVHGRLTELRATGLLPSHPFETSLNRRGRRLQRLISVCFEGCFRDAARLACFLCVL